MDIVGGATALQAGVDVKRKDLNGVMIARLNGDDRLNITVSVKVDKQLIPVIGMSLDRVDSAPPPAPSEQDRAQIAVSLIHRQDDPTVLAAPAGFFFDCADQTRARHVFDMDLTVTEPDVRQ